MSRIFLIVSAACVLIAGIYVVFNQRSHTGSTPPKRREQPNAADAIKNKVGGPFLSLVRSAERGDKGNGKPETIQIAVPSGCGRFDESGWRIPEPGEATISATRRTLVKRSDLEIRETVILDIPTPMRVIEAIYAKPTKGKRRIARQEMAPNRLLAKFRNMRLQRKALDEIGAKVLKRFRSGSILLELPRGISVEDGVVALYKENAVLHAGPDWIVKACAQPNDTDFTQLWGMHNTGQTGGAPDADIDAPEAWDITTGSNNVIVAVIDSGVDYTHPDLAPNMWVNTAEQNGSVGVDDDGNGYIDDIYGYNFADNTGNPLDNNFHGTHCAGTIGAVGNNNQGVTGVCWNVRIMALKFLDEYGYGYTSDAVSAVEYAVANGARVLNNSWGGGSYDQSMYDAIAAAQTQNVLFVAAAGNDGEDNDQYAHYPSSYDLPNVIAVAATDHNDKLASFSNYGATSVDLAAPGAAIRSTFPTYMTWEMTSYGFSTSYEVLSGTSMATPHVAGAAALVLSESPGLSATDLRDRIVLRVDPKANLAGHMTTAGRLNLLNAVDANWTPAEPEVIPVAVSIDDSAGNGNGYAEAGEIVTLSPELINIGQVQALGVVTTLTVSDSYVTVIDDTEAIGNIPPITKTTVLNGYQIQLSVDTPDGHPVELTFTSLDQHGGQTTSSITIYATRERPKAYQELDFAVGEILADRERNIVYVIDKSEFRVISVSLETGSLLKTRYVGGSPAIAPPVSTNTPMTGYMAQSLDGQRLYVAVTSASKIVVLNLPDLTTNSVLSCDFQPVSLAVGVGNRIYASSTDYWGSIRQLDADTGEVLEHFTDGGSIYMHALLKGSPDGERLFFGETGLMTSGGPGYIREFDVSSGGTPVLVTKHPFSQVYMADFAVDQLYRRIYTMNGGIYAVQLTEMDTGNYGETWPLSDAYGKAVDIVPNGVSILAANGFSYNDFTVRRYLRTDGTPIADYQIIPGYNQGDTTKDMQSRQMEIAPNGNVLIAQQDWTGSTDQGIDGTRYYIGILGVNAIDINPPFARFTVTPSLGSAPMEVQFDASESGVSVGSIVSYTWDFGDGNTGTGATPSHTYTTDGEYTVSLKVTDSRGYEADRTGTVICNTAPTANPQPLTTNEDEAKNITLSATDPNGDSLTYQIVTHPSHGTLVGSSTDYLYTPHPNYHGPDSFAFRCNDGYNDSNTAQVQITVISVNDLPVAQQDNAQTGAGEAVAITVLPNDSDVDGDTLSVTEHSQPANGSVSLDADVFTYTPDVGFVGWDSFTYTISDGNGGTDSATVTILVNNAPVADSQTVSLDEDTNVNIALTATDPNGSTLTYSVLQFPINGSLTGSGAARTYTPDPDFFGTDTFTFRANDGYTDSNVAQVTITVMPLNDSPVANNDSSATPVDTSILLTGLLSNDSDADGDVLTLHSFTQTAHGSLVQESATSIRYTPDSGFTGVDTFTYTVSDPAGETASATVKIYVLEGAQAGSEWPTMGAGSHHTSYVPIAISHESFQTGWATQVSTERTVQQVALGQDLVFVTREIYFDQPFVVALHQATGQLVWQRTFDTAYSISPPTYSNGAVYVLRGNHSGDSQLWSLSAISGATNWSSPYSVQWDDHYAPVIDGDNVYIGAGYYGGMYGFDRINGAQHFFVDLQQYDRWTPAVSDGKLYSWVEGVFAEHDRLTGGKLWSLDLGWNWNGWSMDTVAVIKDGQAYVAGSPGLHAIDLTTRTKSWTATGDFSGSPAVGNGVVYGLTGSQVQAFGADTGELRLSYQADESLIWQPIVTANVLLASSESKTYVFDIGTATPRQTIPVGGRLSLGHDRLYIASDTGTLHTYTFALQNNGPVVDSEAWADPEVVVLPATSTLSVVAGDPDGDALTYAWSKVSGPGNVTFTPANAATSEAAFTAPGSYVLRVEVSDGSATVPSDVTVTVKAPLQAESGLIAMIGNDAWKTINLRKSYTSPVVVCTPNYNKNQVPLVPRVRNVTGNSFELKVDRVDGQTGTITGVNVHFLVVEEGVYTAAQHGITMEAGTYTSTTTASNTNWVGELKSFSNTYTTPVVVGQVMSANDPRFSVFWSCGTARTNPADATTLRVGKHTAEDTVKTRADEVVGYIVIEQGSGTIDGLDYIAAVGADSVAGMGNSPAYNYAINGFNSASAVASSAGMDGSDGGWPVLYGDTPTSAHLGLAIDEDQFKDSERSHTSEQVAYIVLENTSPVADAGTDQQVEDADNSGSETVTLDGSASTDTDGTITNYSWTENGTLIGTGATATVDLAVGVHTITLTVTNNHGTSGMDTVVVTVNHGATPSQPGLLYGTVTGNINTTDPNPRTAVTVNLSETEDAIAGNTTEIYTGEIYDADGHISFTEDIDDKTRLYIDGNLVLSSDKWNDRVSTADLNLTPGWHTFELRISNGGGGSGPHSAPGFGYDPNGGTNWVHPADPGDGSLFRTGPPQSAFTTSEDIGGPGLTGSSSHTEGIYTVIGGGNDIWGTTDKFHFTHKAVSGDAEVVVRVTSVQNTNTWAKAGIMMRSGTAANAPFAMVVQRPDKRTCFQWRTTTGGGAAWNGTLMGDTTNAKWLKLKREGDAFTAYYSIDGSTWTQIGTTKAVVLPASAQVGLCVTSHDNSKLCTAVFDNLTITP